MESTEMIYLIRQLAEPVEFNTYNRKMFDRALLKINRDYIYRGGYVYFPPGSVIGRINRLREISTLPKTIIS